MRKDALFLVAALCITAFLLVLFPEKRSGVIAASTEFFLEMILILPAVMVLMGLFSVFVPSEMIVRYLGRESGLKGLLMAAAMGSLPTGPLYVAFPIASALLRKGARVSSVVVFLSAWSCIKLPQEIVELEFLGFKFMLTRLSLTLLFSVLMALVMERVIGTRIGQS